MERVLLDGAIGTVLWNRISNKLPVWQYNILFPEEVLRLHREYIEAGAEIITTNTFIANRFSVSKSEFTAKEIITSAVDIAKKAAENTAVKVALDIGPLPSLLHPKGEITPKIAYDSYREIISLGADAGADIIFFETFMELEMLKIAIFVAEEFNLPIFASMTFKQNHTTHVGDKIEDIAKAVNSMPLSAFGLNCTNQPKLSAPALKELAEHTSLPLIFKPNAGNKDMRTTAREFVEALLELDEIKNKLYIGACCGSDPSYIKSLHREIKSRAF